MDRGAFIKIGNTRIKLNNIKDYGIHEESRVDYRPIGEWHRKIWFSDCAKGRTFTPQWEKCECTAPEKCGYCQNKCAFYDYPFYNCDRMLEEFLEIDDGEWREFIDCEALHEEYLKVKEAAVREGEQKQRHNRENNRFTAVFINLFGTFGMIEETLSQQEAVVPFTIEGSCEFVNTKGRLYYDGSILRCIGSPFKGAKVETETDSNGGKVERELVCSRDREYDDESTLIDSGELKRVDYENTMQPKKVVIKRYLYITTYQNDNYQFSETEYDIDKLLEKLDDNLTI